MPRMADPQEERAHEGELTRMAFLSCSASALSWSSSFILAKCVDGWRRLRQGHGIVVRPSLGPLHRPMLDHPRLPLPPRSLPPTDPQASADRPTEQRTDRPSQPAAAGGLSALFLFIHVVAVAGAAAAGVVPLNLPRLLLLVLVVVGVVGGGDTPLMARSLAANEGQGARVAPAATAAAAAGAAETSANLTFHREGVSEREGQNTSI